MATEDKIAATMTTFLQRNGYTCGRNYAAIGDVARNIQASLPDESSIYTLQAKIKEIANSSNYKFKVRGDSVSAPDLSGPQCGT